MPGRPLILDPDSLPTPASKWDWAFVVLLAALLLFMPFAFGAVEAWSELLVLGGGAALSLCLLARLLFDGEFRLARTWLYIPLLLLLLVMFVQAIPLPAGIVRQLGPWITETKERFLGEPYNPDHSGTLSFYPHNTLAQLRLALVGASVFITVASVFKSPRLIKILLAIVFLIGCLEAILALAQVVTASRGIYWRVPTGQGVVTSGTFVNYSNFAQFVNLSLGAGLALLLVRLTEQSRRQTSPPSWSSVARHRWEKHGLVFLGVIVCAVSVFGSLSRNGVISLVVASFVVGISLAWRGRLSWRGWILGALPAGVFAVLLLFGFDFAYNRLATLHQTDAFRARLDLTAATLNAWRESPWFGTGLGTHEFVVPTFDKSLTPALAAHADNDYAEFLEEMGLCGAVLLGLFLAGIATTIVQLTRRGKSSICAAGYGLAVGLIAVGIHSASDFGQHLPANFCLTATFCGLIVAINGIEKRRRKPSRSLLQPNGRFWLRRAMIGMAFCGVAALSAVVIRAGYAAYIGERWFTAALTIQDRIRDPESANNDDDYADLIASAEGATASDPNNVNYRYWLNYYRWESISRATESESTQEPLSPDAVPLVRRIADDLASARRLCPTFGPPYALEGQLRLAALNEPKGAELIRKGVELAPYDPPTCLVAGELAARTGQLDQARPLLERAVELYPDYFDEVATLYLSELHVSNAALELADSDYNRLNKLARLLPPGQQYEPMRKQIRSQVEVSLRQRISSADATANEIIALARIDVDRSDLQSAITLYRRALGQEYPNVEWRLELARLLQKSGKLDEALHEVRICLRLRPRQPEATRLLEDLTSRLENLHIRSD